MVLALVVVFIFFTILTDGKLVLAQNISNLLLQNAYVLVMACGMLLCILTGGNVDLSVGSTLCLSAALAAKIMDKTKRNAKLEEKMFYVHALHLAKSPSMVEIQESGKEERFSLDLSFIQEIKVLSKKAATP